MNYLELCNEVLVRMREDEITDIADPANEPQQKLVTRFVQDAYDFVLKAHNWNSQRKEWKIPIIEGQNIYELPVSSEGASVYSVELKDDCNKKNDMIEVDAPGMARLDECQTGVPYYYAPSRVVNGKLGLEIWPMPVIPKEPDPEPGPGPNPGPDDPCPCSCGKFTFDPLECLPGEITGGLYEMADTRPITNGVFLNSDGSQGRVQEWLKGEPSNLLPDVNGRAEVFYNNQLRYGFMDLNGAQGRHWTNAELNYEGLPFDKERFDTYEFCALIGHTGNQAANNPPLIETPDVRTDIFARKNGAILFGVGPYLLDANNNSVLQGTGGQIGVERSSPSTIRYKQGNILGGYDYITVNVPPEVLDPNDKYVWISAKVDYGVESLGPANETIPGYDNPSYWGFRYFLKADIYVNGWLAAKDIYGNTNAGYGPADPRKYVQVFVGQDAEGNEIEPTNLKFGNAQTRNGGKDASTVASITIDNPSLDTNELFVAYMDMGAGAAELPSTEFGKNLKRIDPNHTPSEDCDCPPEFKPDGVDRMAILSGDAIGSPYATVNGFLTNESGGASTMPYGPYQNDYPTIQVGSTDGSSGQAYLPFKGFRNHTHWSSANGQDITFAPPEGHGEFHGIPYSATYPADNSKATPTLSFDWEIAVYLDFGMHASPTDDDYLRLKVSGDVNAWWNSSNTSYTQTGGFNSGSLILNGDGEVEWQKGSYAESPSQLTTQLADREQMTGWYIIRAKQNVEWVDAGGPYSKWKGDAEHSIETPWGYTYSETITEDGYESGSGVTNYLRVGTAYGGSPGADLSTQGASAVKVVAGAAIYADRKKGETIPRDVLDWYVRQRADYVPPVLPSSRPAAPRTTEVKGDLTELAGPAIVEYAGYPVSRNEDFTFAIDFFMESNIKYQNLFTLGGNSDKYYGSIHAYSTNSNGLIINSSVSGTTTDGTQIFRWIPSQNGGVDINGVRRSIVIQKVDRSVTVWLDGKFHVNLPASSASEIEFNVDPFANPTLKLYAFANDSLITDPADNAIVYGHRFTPGVGVYPMDAETIVPEYGPPDAPGPDPEPPGPNPDDPAYTGDDLVVNGYGMAPKLVANEDMCEIPEQVVLYYALSLASRERGEVGGMAAAEIFALSKQYLADAIARDIGNSRHEYTWETV